MLSDGDKKRAREIVFFLVGGKLRRRSSRTKEWPKTRKLLRVKSKLRNIKVKLDEAYLAGLTEKYRRTSALINRGRRMNHHALTQLTALVGFFAATNSIHFQNI